MIFARDLQEEAEVAGWGGAGGASGEQHHRRREKGNPTPPPLSPGGGRGFGLMQSYKVVEWEAAPPL